MHKLVGWLLFLGIVTTGIYVIARVVLIRSVVNADLNQMMTIPKAMGVKPMGLPFGELPNPKTP